MKEKLKNNYFKKYRNLEKALNDGAKIHIFRSGGGLRVIRVEKKGKLISYGEHPYLSGALSHVDKDFGLSYNDQYLGKNAKHDHYYTGAYPIPSDALDNYVFYTASLDIFYSVKWGRVVCTTSIPFELNREKNRENEIRWGSSDNLVGAITSCILSFNFEDEESFKKRV